MNGSGPLGFGAVRAAHALTSNADACITGSPFGMSQPAVITAVKIARGAAV